MNEKKYDNLVRMRKDIQKDKDKVDAIAKIRYPYCHCGAKMDGVSKDD